MTTGEKLALAGLVLTSVIACAGWWQVWKLRQPKIRFSVGRRRLQDPGGNSEDMVAVNVLNRGSQPVKLAAVMLLLRDGTGLFGNPFIGLPVLPLQSQWLNNPNFPNGQKTVGGGQYTPPTQEPGDGPDPIVGEHDDNAQVALYQQSGVHPFPVLTELVSLSAGDYFFCPSISAVGRLATGQTTSSKGAVPAAS
jgi:hypothetical protein